MHAQDVRISGEVSSALTQEGVPHAIVRIMTIDGQTQLASDTTRYRLITEKGDKWENTYPDKQSGAIFSLIVPIRDNYLLRVEAENFEPYQCPITPKAGGNKINVPAIHLMPRSKERQLGEAEVKATRIKMFYKGDTLVYNADAFNVAQTESLRKLVEQLPGAEMKDGEIRINGKRIDNLLLSGKDFFKGNIQAALDNLPAYIVSRIKVYDKSGELSELVGRDMHDESYVMDVHLKRQYIGIWMAKLEADGGTEKLWGAQGFLMRFDDRQMFTLNADINNFSQSRQMNDICNTLDRYPGKTASKAVRLSYYIEPNATWRFTAEGSAKRKDTDLSSWENTETYLSPVNLMTRNADRADNKEIEITSSAHIRARKKAHWQHSLNYDFSFAHNRNTRDAHGLSYYLPSLTAWEGLSLDSIIRMEEDKAEDNALLNSLFNPQLIRSYSTTHRPTWKSSFVLGTDLINFNTTLKHHTQTQREFSNYRLTTYANHATDARRRYQYRHDYAFDLTPELEWTHQYERIRKFDGVITLFLRYAHRYGTANHPEYRLERMTEWAGQIGWGLESLGLLPETEWQSLCLDEKNSFYSSEKEGKAEAGIRISHKFHLTGGTSLQFNANESVYHLRRTLDYSREESVYRPSRKGIFFQPALTLKWKHESREGRTWMPEWETGYQGQPTMPALTRLLPIRDASDPLNLFVGNQELGNAFSHQVNSSYRLEHVKSGRTFNLSTTYRRLHNDIATQSYFDADTGIRTYQPVNTSRTHSIQGHTEYTTALDKKKRLYLSASFSSDYYQTENLSFLTEENKASAGLLRNVGLTPYMSLKATFGDKFRFYGRWMTSFRHVSQPGMSDSYRQTGLYANIYYTLPFGIEFNTTIRTTFYAGNSLQTLNRTTTNWQASLGKVFFNERLTISLTANDILGQADSYRSEVTANNRIESYTNVLPRYVMLQIHYTFSKTGGNRQ